MAGPFAIKPVSGLSEQEIERFFRYVDRRGDNECWPWRKARVGGYGVFNVKPRRQLKAHRIAYFLATGSEPGVLCVCHHCDNPPCCNPAHMFLGTVGDNNADKGRKGRAPSGDNSWTRKHPERLARGDRNGMRVHPESVRRGSSNGAARLNEDKVREIRTKYANGQSMASLGVEYGVSDVAIRLTVRRLKWKHVA